MSALEPGIYRATVRGVPDTIVMIRKVGVMPTEIDGVVDRDDITDARPLIVLDPEALDWPEENRDKTSELARMIRLMCNNEQGTYRSDMVRQIADVIDPPVRIPEPGLWGVVEASVPEGDGETSVFLNIGGRLWRHCATGRAYDWSALFNPTLIRDGIES